MRDEKTFYYLMGILMVSAAALIGGFLIGRETAPEPSPEDSMIVTESASPEDANRGFTALIAQEAPGPGSGKEYTQIVDVMDNMRHVVEERFMAADGKLVPCEDGYAIVRKKYDSAGNNIEVSYYDQKDKPVMVESLGYSSVSMTYDEKGKKLVETYYDDRGGIVVKAGQDYARMRYTYDDAGNVASESYFDTDVREILGPDGFHRAEYTYDADKHVLTDRYYGTDGSLIVSKKGYAGADHAYDENGDETRTAYYGTDGKISENSSGVAIVLKKYNELHQVIEE